MQPAVYMEAASVLRSAAIFACCFDVQSKKKKKPKPQTGSQTDPVQAECTSPSDGKDAVNGLHGNGSGLDGDSADSLSEQLDSTSLDTVELDCRSAVSELTEPAPGSDGCPWREAVEELISVLAF